MIKINKALDPVKGIFMVLTISLGPSQGAWTSDLPYGGSNSNNRGGDSVHQEKISPTGQKGGESGRSLETATEKSWFKFEPLSPYRVTFPFPGGYVRVPLLKPSIMAAMGVGSLLGIPEPLNYMVGFPLLGLGAATRFVPSRATTMGRILMGSSIGGVTFLTTALAVSSWAIVGFYSRY